MEIPLPIAAAESETGRRVVAWSDGRFALFNLAEDWRAPIVEWQGPADVTSLTLEHDPDRIVTVSRSGETKSWPFFRDVSALISFARDHIPFNGEGRLTLSHDDLCKIAPPLHSQAVTYRQAEQEEQHDASDCL